MSETTVVIDLMTAEEVATAVRLKPKTIREIAAGGGIPHYRVAGQYRFDRAEVHRWIESRRAAEGATTTPKEGT